MGNEDEGQVGVIDFWNLTVPATRPRHRRAGTRHDIWYLQILKKLSKSQYLGVISLVFVAIQNVLFSLKLIGTTHFSAFCSYFRLLHTLET